MNLKKKEVNETINVDGTEKKGSMFKRIIKNRIFIAVLFFILGGVLIDSEPSDVEKENESTKMQVETKKSVDTAPTDDSIDTANQEATSNNEESTKSAIDNVKADWNKNALAKAKTYQDQMSMSPDAIADQLQSEYGEKFTADEASYAVEHLNN